MDTWKSTSKAWQGIEFNENGEIIQVNLSGWGLAASKTVPIWNTLKSVTVIDLSVNNLSGEFKLLNCSGEHLRHLNLSRNMLNGSLQVSPSWVSLESLDVSGNRLSGEITGANLNYLKSLKVLNLSHNEFRGSIPPELGQLSSLEKLDMRANNFSGTLPDELGSLKSLTNLCLTQNQLTGEIPLSFSNCTKLVQLELSRNKLTGGIPSELGNLGYLSSLSLGYNSLSNPLHFQAGKFQSLQSLYIPNNTFRGVISGTIGNLIKIRKLILTGNQLSGPIPTELGNLTHLEELWLNSNNLTGLLPNQLFRLGNLRYLALDDNQLTGNIPSQISDLAKLEVLWLEKNKFYGELPPSIGNLTKLLMMSVAGNNLGWNIPTSFRNLTNLIGLDVGDNSFNDASALSGLPSLEFLFLTNNKFSGNIPSWIWSFKSLKALDFSFNNLIGDIPRNFSALTKLTFSQPFNASVPSASVVTREGRTYQGFALPTTIDLSHNNLTGNIPPELGMLTSLQFLILGYNNLTGSIPDTLSNISQLMWVDVSHNQLSGVIPLGLSKLSFLAYFDVSFNNFSGEIPNTAQFNTFDPSWFKGNQFLCGIPLGKCVNSSSTQGGRNSEVKEVLWKLLPLYITICGAVGAFAFLIVYLYFARQKLKLWSMYRERLERENSFFETMTFTGGIKVCPKQLAEATNNYNQANIIGDGGFGIVYRAVLETGEVVAVKKLSCGGIQGDKEFRSEVQILGRIRHPHLVPLLGYFSHRSERLLIYKYLTNGSLDTWLHCRESGVQPLDWPTRLKIARGAAQGISFLHHECFPPIIHRDIKVSNILLDEEFEAHVADFGMARLVEVGQTHVTTDVAGTVGYIPPEYNHKCIATTKGDVYGFGVVCLEILTAKRPTDCVFRKCGTGNLVSWIMGMKTIEDMKAALDPGMGITDGNVGDILEMMRVGCLCCREMPLKRPNMLQVVEVLEKLEKRVLSYKHT